MTMDSDGPLSPAEAEAVARLRNAAADAADLYWPLSPSDVIGERTHVLRSRGIRIATMIVAAAAIVAGFLAPFPALHLGGASKAPSTSPPPVGSHRPQAETNACITTTPGVAPAPASLRPGFLSAGFRLTAGNPANLAAGTVTYSLTGPDPARVEFSLSNDSGPLTPAVGGRPTARSVRIQGLPGLLESGPPDPAFIGVYWKPKPNDLVSLVGYKMLAATVLQVADHADVSAGGVVALPIAPGSIISRAKAVAIAQVEFPQSTATAKLSSWTEVSRLIQASDYGKGMFAVPATLAGAPWTPIWGVLVIPRQQGSAPAAQAGRELVILNAATGTKELTASAGDHSSWFSALTDRDPSLRGCPGGSTARLPFGVLTRDEEAYTLANAQQFVFGDLQATIVLKLTTIPTLNRADPGLYGGCLQQSCSLDELVWPTIEVLRAPPGKTLSCPPPWVSTPSGIRSKPTKQYVIISVPNNSESGCGALPAWVSRLKDLAPPLPG